MPQVRKLSRSEVSPFASRVAGAIPAGSTITVGANDNFYGLRFGSCELVLAKGAHTVDEELEGGWFIQTAGMDVPFEDDLGVMNDSKDNKGKILVRGTIRVRIDEPKDFAATHNEELNVEELGGRVHWKVRELLEEKLRDMLAGERYLTSLQSSKMIDLIKKDVLVAWTSDGERDSFAAIELPKVEVRVTTITDAPPPPEPEAPAPPPPAPAGPESPAGARVHVVWADGSRYPGTVRATGALVTFDDGQEHWIPTENLLDPGKS